VPYGAEVFFVFWGVFVMKDLKKDLEALGDLVSLVGHTGKKLYRKSQGFVREVRYDIAAFRQRDPAAKSDLEVLLLYSGLHARTAHRLSHALYKNGHTFAARAVSQGAKALTGIEIHPGATIGKGLVIDHGSGVVIGETAEIGDNCTLYQGVTLGGTGKDVGKRHPTLGNNVMVGAGAKILGPMKIGDNTKIAAGAVVLDEIPADSTAVGIPAKVVKVAGERVANDLDQIHIPDPVAQELSAVRAELQALEDKIKKLEKKKTAPRKPAVKK
jgi:serine O-acetyltransferase